VLTLVAKLTVKPGQEDDFLGLMTSVVPKVREEPGNKAYAFHRSVDNSRTFMFYEKYDDEAALAAHGRHLQELGVDFRAMVETTVLEFYQDIA